ncbi:MAG TPA: bifunctional 4-hydroxy-2-oxoglutarate aldolase/2-dehydro-3-deoxy-phosphogluconate aldolase [Anaerolineales bacterium]|nr:bifunctional 4-hydroxy-2-oxoglutarate aldolase/2-dehydro-3-deoxy-phosphogluconate aldolase [Anaerolineales bacterium]
MAKYSRLKVLTTMIETGLVPIFYHADIEVASQVVAACLAGGAKCVEFTNRGDQAHLVFEKLVGRFSAEEVILGAGSVIDAATAALYIQLGANFIVSPVLVVETAHLCNRRKVAYSPGCGSVSEISQAEELGVEICKIFPGGQVGGPGFVKAVRGPMSWTRIMPTGGVSPTEENIKSWIEAGAACLGMGSKLISKDLVAAGDYAAIRENVKKALAWIGEARQGVSPI